MHLRTLIIHLTGDTAPASLVSFRPLEHLFLFLFVPLGKSRGGETRTGSRLVDQPNAP